MDDLSRRLREYYQSQRIPSARIDALAQDVRSPAAATQPEAPAEGMGRYA